MKQIKANSGMHKEDIKDSVQHDIKRILIGSPNGIRTRVTALRGPRPRPLDDGTEMAGERGFEPL